MNERLQIRQGHQRAQRSARRVRRRRLEIDAEILRHVAMEQRDCRAGEGSQAPCRPGPLEALVSGRSFHGHLAGGVAPPSATAAAAGVALSFMNPSDSSVRPIELTFG